MTICNFLRKVRSKFSINFSQPSSGRSNDSIIDNNNNNNDKDSVFITSQFEIIDFDIANEQQGLPRRYYSVDTNQRRTKLNLNLGLSQKSSVSSRKSLILKELEKNGAPFFANSCPEINLTRCSNSFHYDLNWKNVYQYNSTISINGCHYTNVTEKDFCKISEIGSGNFGYVQKCHHFKSGLDVAIKRMKYNCSDFEDIGRHVFKDLELLSKSQHDHIVKFYGYILTDNRTELWLCMELMDLCFDRLIKHLQPNKTIPENIIGAVTVSIVEALSYLTKIHNIIHRDIKPANILINRGGLIKLCDFGISGGLVDSKTSSQTMGSIAYLAPERIQSNDGVYDDRVDVWSLGLSLLEMALGHFPYENWSFTFEIITKIMNKKDVPSLSKSKTEYSTELKHFIDACLQHDYRQRYKYDQLKRMKFYTKNQQFNVQDVSDWFNLVY